MEAKVRVIVNDDVLNLLAPCARVAVLGLIFGVLYQLHKSGHFVISSTSGRAH
jgi:hypothetical protein